MELANVELGVRLGLYEALAGRGPVTAAELAGRARIAPRYAREWLEQQAVALWKRGSWRQFVIQDSIELCDGGNSRQFFR